MPPITTTSAREARSVPLSTRRPASATCLSSGALPITKAVRPVWRSASTVLHRAADRDHVAQRGADADLPELRDEVLAGLVGVVGGEGEALARRAQLLERLDDARRGLAADPDAAVEVEDELVVAGGEGGERHRASLRARAAAPAHLLCRSRSCPPWRRAPAAGTTTGGGEQRGGGAERPGERQASSSARAAVRGRGSPAPQARRRREAPDQALDAGATYDVVLQTNCGDITIRLDQKASPKTAASFASLAKSGFFDDTVFHRIVPGFVIQGGDPTGTGTGGPGYSTRDVPPQDDGLHEGHGRDGQDRRRAAGDRGQPVLHRDRPRRRACRRSTRCSGRS